MAAIAGQMAVARAGEQAPTPGPQLFKEVNELRDSKKKEAGDDEHVRFPKSSNIFGRIAIHPYFSSLTFFFIGLNSLYIGFDANYSAVTGKPDNLWDKDTPIGFLLMENVFCIYFTGEVIIRFISYQNKVHCLFDAWFRFDSVLVLLMVLETWIFPLFNVGSALKNLSVLRLLRLLRISRMARLMKKVPELMIILKGLVASFRSVGCTAILQVAILYVFSIIFVAEYHEKGAHDPESCDDGKVTYYFGTMGKSFYSLFIFGTILDDVTQVTDIIRVSTEDGNCQICAWELYLTFFIIFILLSSFTILNMLIGILCEVVAATADSEKQKAAETCVKEAMVTLFDKLDVDGNGTITEDEFMKMRDDDAVASALEDMDICESQFGRYCEILFHKEEVPGQKVKLSFETVINMILRLSPGNSVNALDFSLLQASLDSTQDALSDRISKMSSLIADFSRGGSDPTKSASERGFGESATGTSLPAAPRPKSPYFGAPDPLGPDSKFKMEMFSGTTSHEILEELERRLGVTGNFSDFQCQAMPTRPEGKKAELQVNDA